MKLSKIIKKKTKSLSELLSITDISLLGVILLLLTMYEFLQPSLKLLDAKIIESKQMMTPNLEDECSFLFRTEILVKNESFKPSRIDSIKFLTKELNPDILTNKHKVSLRVIRLDKKKSNHLLLRR